MNHYARVCRQGGGRTGTKTKMGRIVRSVSGNRGHSKLVSVYIDYIQIQAVPDTGSDWDCVSRKGLQKLKINEKDLLKPTRSMYSTQTASGSSMQPLGYREMEIGFGDLSVRKPVVLFDMVDEVILSLETLRELEIIQIRYRPEIKTISSTSTANKPEKPPKPDWLKERVMKKKSATKKQVVEEYKDVFAARDEPFGKEKYKIHLEPNAIPCRVTKCRNIAYANMGKLKKELEKLTEEKIISKMTVPTEWVNPIVVTNKKNSDDIRLCIDFRHLNKFCQREHFTSLTVQETVQLMEADKAKFFSKFDAKKGYHQCELDEESKNLTTFLTPFGRFRYERAPFGVNSIPEHYNRRMREALESRGTNWHRQSCRRHSRLRSYA